MLIHFIYFQKVYPHNWYHTWLWYRGYVMCQVISVFSNCLFTFLKHTETICHIMMEHDIKYLGSSTYPSIRQRLCNRMPCSILHTYAYSQFRFYLIHIGNTSKSKWLNCVDRQLVFEFTSYKEALKEEPALKWSLAPVLVQVPLHVAVTCQSRKTSPKWPSGCGGNP